MRLLAIIPARGGSKRVPGKNKKLLGGIPLIAWTIKAAKASNVCADIVVSTDDEEIESIAIEFGAMSLGLRPPELATDTASSVDVALHTASEYERVHGPLDGLVFLQPTSPFRTTAKIREAVSIFGRERMQFPVVSVSPVAQHPAWCFSYEDGEMKPYESWLNLARRSQNLPPVWALNGSIYIISCEELRKSRQFVKPGFKGVFITDHFHSIDIDTESDWAFAEMVAKGLVTDWQVDLFPK